MHELRLIVSAFYSETVGSSSDPRFGWFAGSTTFGHCQRQGDLSYTKVACQEAVVRSRVRRRLCHAASVQMY